MHINIVITPSRNIARQHSFHELLQVQATGAMNGLVETPGCRMTLVIESPKGLKFWSTIVDIFHRAQFKNVEIERL